MSTEKTHIEDKCAQLVDIYDEDDDDDDDGSLKDYYGYGGEDDIEDADTVDPERFSFECLSVDAVECLLNEWVEQLSTQLRVTPALAKQLLQRFSWNVEQTAARYTADSPSVLVQARIKPVSGHTASSPHRQQVSPSSTVECPVCTLVSDDIESGGEFSALSCGHAFCRDCWAAHLQVQLTQGVASNIECMSQRCNVLVPEDFAISVLKSRYWRERYQQYMFSDCIKNHPQLRFCPGPNCSAIIRAIEPQAKRVICSCCKSSFCFLCGVDYHAPAGCDVIRRWLTKCADDSETANYISANTKDCPKCHICIEKNGGCNHMQCFSCKFEFCWMCLGGWNTHGSEYYECSRYKENPNIVNETAHAKAREALKKYLHYYERWENHAKSLSLEAQTRQKISDRINQKVNDASGTWIDWHYLLDAAALLAKCRYTLQYTYPFAYYFESGPRKELFEYQQAQLEADIENLSWRVERAESTDRGVLENHMSSVERSRTQLLREFLDN